MTLQPTAQLIVRKGTVADRTNAVVAALGAKTLNSANILVAEENGQIVGAACGVVPAAGDTAMLGEFRFRGGNMLTPRNGEAFRALLKAHVTEAAELGFTYGESIVRSEKVKELVEQAFNIKAEVFGRTDGKPSSWRFVIVLKDFLKVL